MANRALLGLALVVPAASEFGVNLTDVRADVCARSAAVVNGSVGIADALRGARLTFSAALYDDDWIACDAATGACTGFHAELLAELASSNRAGFEFDIVGIPSAEISDWSSYLGTAVRHYDANMDWWLQTAERAASGIKCPYTFLEMSILSATLASADEPSFMETAVSAFDGPFHPNVWFTIVAVTVFTSALYFWLEAAENETDVPPESALVVRLTGVLYLGAAQIAGGEGFAPQTGWGKMLILSYSFFVLLSVSAYTASLATSLIVSAGVSIAYKDFDDAVAKGARACVMANTAMSEFIEATYPNANLVPVAADPYGALALGECELAVSTKQPEYDFAVVGGPGTNPGCALMPVGGARSVIKTYGGGWMTAVDYSDKCTSLIADALGYWLINVDLDGTVARLYSEMEARKTLKPCGADVDDGGDEATQLSVDQMSGVFLLHGFVSACVLFGAIGHRLGWPKKVGEEPEDERPSTKSDLKRFRREIMREMEVLQAEVIEKDPRARRISQSARYSFHQLDVNKDGEITFEQAKEQLRALGVTFSDAKLDEVLAAADDDGDGMLQLNEFVTIMKQDLGCDPPTPKGAPPTRATARKARDTEAKSEDLESIWLSGASTARADLPGEPGSPHSGPFEVEQRLARLEARERERTLNGKPIDLDVGNEFYICSPSNL